MEPIVGIFTSSADAERAAESLLRDSSPEHFGLGDFKRGYERGQRHLR